MKNSLRFKDEVSMVWRWIGDMLKLFVAFKYKSADEKDNNDRASFF